ncbi:MAG: DNA replication/repair protein RecF [Selenomonadaceae bacterium]|nr:DNA replication/repair protein RecF [Selenomonadaceae bacterium]
MHVNKIFLNNYRNYIEQTVEPVDGLNIFVGANAQGKTNLIESMEYAALGRSQRASKDVELIRWDQSSAVVRLSYQKFGVEHSIAFELNRQKPRRILLDDQPIRIRELIGKFNVVYFSPEDLFLIKGSPSNRRRFLDAEISQASPAYFNDLLNYNRVLAQRNALLKKIKDGVASSGGLALWDEQLANFSARIVVKRLEVVGKLSSIAGKIQSELSKGSETLAIDYEAKGVNGSNFGSGLTDELATRYHNTLNRLAGVDIARGTTTIGPHLDDLKFMINGRELRAFGSQGQQRTAVLALKLSELEFLNGETGTYPVLLLDDVMSELDSARRIELIDFLKRNRIQTFITAVGETYFDHDLDAAFFNVDNAVIVAR